MLWEAPKIQQLSGSIEGVSDQVHLKSGIAKAQGSPARMFGQCVIVYFTITQCPKGECKFILNKSSALGLGRINVPVVTDSTTHSLTLSTTQRRERAAASTFKFIFLLMLTNRVIRADTVIPTLLTHHLGIRKGILVFQRLNNPSPFVKSPTGF